MAPSHVQWSALSAPLQTEILYNMSADRRQGWSRIVSRLQLTRQQEEEAIKHIHRRTSQEDAEERYLKQRQRAQREFLLKRGVHSSASQSEEYPQTLLPAGEDSQLLDSEYHICRTREVLLARRFLKNHQLDPMLAGDWGVVGEELEESEDEPPDSPLLSLDDFGFDAKPTIYMRSVDQERQVDDLSSTVRFLNSFGREATSHKGRAHKDHHRSKVPLLPWINSTYQYNRNKHIRRMIALRRSRGAQPPGGSYGGSQEVRLKVDDMGAANIENSPPAQMPPISSTPPSLKDDESTLLVSPQDLFKVAPPSSSVESVDISPLRAASDRARGDGNTATSGTGSDNPKAILIPPATSKSQEKEISPQIEKTTDIAEPAETSSKLGRKRKREPEKKNKETEFLEEARFHKPVTEVPTTIPRRKNITEKPLPQKTPKDRDDTAKRPAKIKKHQQRIESIIALEQERSTETPKSSKEDVFDNIPGKEASVAPPRSHHRTQSNHIPVEKPRLRTRRSETVAVTVAADKPYSLRSDNGSSDTVVVNKVEVVRSKEIAAEEAVIGSPRVKRKRGVRRSGM